MNVPGYNTDKCEICDIPETNLHLLYFCSKVNGLFKSILCMIEQFCNIKIIDPFAFVFFDFRVSGKWRNICAVIISSYISIIWNCRNEQLGHIVLVWKFKNKLRYNIKSILLCSIVNEELQMIFQDMDHRCEIIFINLYMYRYTCIDRYVGT